MRSASYTSDPAPMLLRVRVRLHRWNLDQEIAAGNSRRAAGERALRSLQLAEPRTRRRLARSLRRVVAEADRPRGPRLEPTVPTLRDAVVRSREALLGLAERLEQPVPMSATAIARVRVLLSDGTGPLYSRQATQSLSDMVWWVADGLALCTAHDWRCPVIMKTDPGHVAWTCARCGATAASDSFTALPAA